MAIRNLIPCLLVAFVLYLSGASAAPEKGLISGKVTVEGQPLQPKSINMSSEPSCAKQYPTPPTAEDVVVGKGGALENVLVYVSAGAPEEATVPSEPVAITQKGCRFVPHITVVQANQPLKIANEDSTMHNVHPMPTVNREWNKPQPPGTPPLTEAFAREEIIPVQCNIHAWMRTYVAVLKTSHYSLTGEDGSFTLSGLPAGKYTIKAWHEMYGTQTQDVVITAGEAKAINFSFQAKH